MGKNSIIGKKLQKAGLLDKIAVDDMGDGILQESSIMALYILQERLRGETSNFHEYIEMLPFETAKNFPMCFSDEELMELNGSNFIKDCFAPRAEKLRSEYDFICSKVPEMRNFAYEEFREVVLIVKARSLTGNLSGKAGGETTKDMVPLFDMANHDGLKPNICHQWHPERKTY